MPSHASHPRLSLPFLHRPRRARKALEMAFSRARYYGDPKYETKVLIFFNIITFRGGYKLVTCYVLLAKKPETVPQMIPNFKGGFKSGPRSRGAD